MNRILVVIPAYNEAARLPDLLAAITAYVRSPLPRQHGFDIEFTIVDDGSRAEEFAAAERLLATYALGDVVRVIRQERNRGKGAAIRAGFQDGLSRSYEYLGFMDADGAVSVSELHDALVYLTARQGRLAGVIGSRVRMLGRTVLRSPVRHCIGRVFATFVSVHFGCAVYDTQCGLKVFEAGALRRYLDVPVDERWIWDTELLIAMLRGGEQIHEIPINWRETGQSKVSLVRDPLRMFLGLLRFKRRLVPIPAWVRYADAATIVLLALAFIVFVTGGLRQSVAGVTLSVTSGARPLLWAMLIAGLRHVVFRGHTLLDRLLAAGRLPGASAPPLVRDEGTVARRAAARPGVSEVALVVGLMVVLAVLMTYPQVRQLDSLPDPGDPLFSTWRLAWIAHQLAHDPLHLFDGNIFYPERHTLAFSDSIVLPGLVGAPFLWLGLPAVHFYNVYLMATFAMAGIAMYLFVRSLTGELAAALVAAIIFAFYPFRFEHYSHFELQFSFWMPLALWALQRTFERGRLRDGLLTGGAVAGQTLSSLYFGIYLTAYLVPISIVLGLGWQRFRGSVKPLLAGACLAIVLVLPMVVPYLQVRNSFGERSSAEVEFYSARPQHYLVAHQTRSPYANILGGRHEGERELFPGILVVGLALVAIWPPLSVVRIAYVIGLVFAFDASLGSHGAVHSFFYTWLLPFRGLRVPARFSMLVGLSLAILAGFGVARLTARLPRRSFKYALAAVLSAIVLLECRPTLELEPAPRVPAIYQWFRGRPAPVVAALPPGSVDEPWRRDCAYLYFSTSGWPRLLNGNSGMLPPSYWQFNAAMSGFPDERSLNLLRQRGVQYVVLHEQLYGRTAYKRVVEAVEGRDDLSKVVSASSGGYEGRIYQLVR